MPGREKTFISNAKTKVQISCAVTPQLISTFVFATCRKHVDSTIPLLYKCEIPGTLPFPVAGQLGLCLTWLGTPKTVFLATGLIFYLQFLRNLRVIYCCN